MTKIKYGAGAKLMLRPPTLDAAGVLRGETIMDGTLAQAMKRFGDLSGAQQEIAFIVVGDDAGTDKKLLDRSDIEELNRH